MGFLAQDGHVSLWLGKGLMVLGRGLIGDGKHQGDVSRPGYMGDHKVRMFLCSRKEKHGGKNMGTAFSLKKDVIRKIIAVLDSKEDLK